MRKSLGSFIISITLLILFCFTQCKKQVDSATITLYNQPLPVIQSYISNRWKLEFVRGGFIANYVKSFQDENIMWQISSNRIIENYNGNIYADTTINWIKEPGIFTNGDSTFTMNFYDNRGYPYVYIVDGIVKDSLILREYGFDGQRYCFSKSN